MATTFGYDIVYKLLSETIASDPGPANNGAIGYSHDAVGNRLTRTSTVAAITPSSATYDANDRTSGDTFDNNGNALTSGGNSYSYDFLDRLTSLNSGVVAMVYDGDGNRVVKVTGGMATKYLVDDNNTTGYAQMVEEVVGGALQRRYAFGSMRISQSQLISGNWLASYYGYDARRLGAAALRHCRISDLVCCISRDGPREFKRLHARLAASAGKTLASQSSFEYRQVGQLTLRPANAARQKRQGRLQAHVISSSRLVRL